MHVHNTPGTVIPPGEISGQSDATEKRRISVEGRSKSSIIHDFVFCW